MAGETTAKKTAAQKTAEKKTTAKKTTAKKTAEKNSSASSRSTVKKGDQVVVQVNPLQNNGDAEAVGFVTKVDDMGEPTVLSVKVLLDGDENLSLRNVPLLTKRAANKKDAPPQYAVRA